MSFLKALPAAALLFLPSSAATVHSLSVVPSSGKAEVVIGVNAAVDVQDFALEAPYRVVVDLKGATLDMSRRTYDRVSRGGITNVRYSQFRPNVVRVVIDLDAKHPYTVTRNTAEVRISVTGGKTADYTAWPSTESRRAYVAAPSPPTVRPLTLASADVTRARTASTPDRTTTTVGKAVAQQTSVAQVDAQDDPAPAVAGPVTAKIISTYDVKPIALFSAVQQSQQPPITVTFQDTDIRDVIASFAAFSGRTIVVGKDVQGTVTAEVKNQPWDVALRAILQGQGLAASEDLISGIITVDSYANILNRQASEPLQTQLVSINYARASALVPTIQSLLQKDCPQISSSPNVVSNARPNCIARGLVAADSTTNTLIITETASRLADVLQYVRNLDVRTPQVGIKAKIIFVNRTNIEDIGLSYDLGTGTDQFFSQLVKRPDPDRERKCQGCKPGAQRRVLDGARQIPADKLPRRAPGSSSRRSSGRTEHRDARQQTGFDSGRSGNSDQSAGREHRQPGHGRLGYTATRHGANEAGRYHSDRHAAHHEQSPDPAPPARREF